MEKHGQASLEYLIVNAIGFVLMAITITAGIALYDMATFVLDAKNAEGFMDKIEVAVERLGYFGEGTTLTVEANTSNEWLIEKIGNGLQLEINGKTMSNEIKRELGEVKQNGEIILSGHSIVKVKKIKGAIEIEKVGS